MWQKTFYFYLYARCLLFPFYFYIYSLLLTLIFEKIPVKHKIKNSYVYEIVKTDRQKVILSIDIRIFRGKQNNMEMEMTVSLHIECPSYICFNNWNLITKLFILSITVLHKTFCNYRYNLFFKLSQIHKPWFNYCHYINVIIYLFKKQHN